MQGTGGAVGKFQFTVCNVIVKYEKQKSNFSNDYVTLYDGSLSTSPMMGKYCGDSIPPSHVSSSNEILIQFQSDGSITYNGFKMEYNPTGNTSIQNNFEYYGDYYTELREYSLFLDDFFSYRIN